MLTADDVTYYAMQFLMHLIVS